jgi:TolB protein
LAALKAFFAVPTLAIIALASAAGGADPALVFSGEDGTTWDLWRRADGAVARMTVQLDADSPATATDGRLAFADASGTVWVRALDGKLTAVTGMPTPCAHPAWSPDGQQLVVACFRFNNRQDDGALWLADLESGAARLLYDGPGLQKSPAWSPDGQRLAFVSGFRLTPTRVIEQIWVLELAGGTARRLIEGEAAAVNPAWSPDGKRLAYASDRGDTLDIWVMDLSEGRQLQLTHDPAYDDDPTWSPDGETLAFQSTRGGELEIWSIPASGGTARRLVAAGESGLRSARSPHWPVQQQEEAR